MNKPKSKADAIRIVAAKDSTLSNRQILTLVRQRFNLTVGDNEIINVLGSMKDRLRNVQFSKLLKDKAKNFLIAIGDLTLAIRLLKMADCEVRRDS